MSMMYDVYSSETSLQIVRGVECNQDIFDSVRHTVRYGGGIRSDRCMDSDEQWRECMHKRQEVTGNCIRVSRTEDAQARKP